jgi:hypothetical protein
MAISRRQTNETLRSDMWRACDILRRDNNVGGLGALIREGISPTTATRSLPGLAVALVANPFDQGLSALALASRRGWCPGHFQMWSHCIARKGSATPPRPTPAPSCR